MVEHDEATGVDPYSAITFSAEESPIIAEKAPTEPKPGNDLPPDDGKDALDDDDLDGDGSANDDANTSDDDLDREDDIELDGTSYKRSKLIEAMKNGENDKAWKKTNTEAAMKIAEDRKTVEPLHQFLSKIKEKPELLEAVKEVIEDELGADGAAELTKLLGNDALMPHPAEGTLKTAQDDLSAAEVKLNVLEQVQILQETESLSYKQAKSVLDFAVKHHQETGVAVSLPDAFKLMDYEKLKASGGKQKAPEKTPSKRARQKIPKKQAKSFEEIDATGYKLTS